MDGAYNEILCFNAGLGVGMECREKMKLKKCRLLLYLLLVWTLPIHSQVIPLDVAHITATAAPLRMKIQAVLLGSEGYLWIASQNGLLRYDGYRVIPCRLDGTPGKTGTDPSVRSIVQDSNGRLWLATAQGLVCYDPADGTSIRYRHNTREPETISADDLTCLSIFPLQPDWLWIASANGDLDRLDLSNGLVVRISKAAAGVSGPGRIHVICGDPAGFLWLGAANGLYRFLPRQSRLQFCEPPAAVSGRREHFTVKAIFLQAAAPDTLWIGSEDAGFFRYSPAAGSWQHYMEAGTLGNKPADFTINTIAPFPGESQNLLIGTEEGLSHFDPRSGRFDRVFMLFNNTDMQFSRCTGVVYCDPHGIYWIGSCRDGLDKWSPAQKGFSDFQPYEKNLPSPLANWVTSMQERDSGMLLLTTYGGGAFTFDPRANRFRRLLLDPGNPDRELNSFITDSFVGRDGTLWFSTEEGLAHCSAAGRLLRLYDYGTGQSAANKIMVYSVTQDAKGIFWMGTDHGLIRLDPKNGELRYDQHDHRDPYSLSNNRVNIIVEETDGAIWMGTDDGLNLSLPGRSGFSSFKNNPADPVSLSNNLIYFLKKDTLGRIWACTDDGLNLVRREREKVVFRRYRVPGGDRKQNCFVSLVEENSRYFWLGSKAGLVRFDTEGGTFVFYDRRDGVVADERNEPFLAFRGRDGEIYFGGRWGFTRFRPAQIALNPNPPQVVMTGFRTGSEREDAESSAPFLFPSSRQPMVFTPTRDQDVLRIEFAALDFLRPEKNQYAYRLEGRDRDWIYQGSNRVVSLVGLKPGRHMLRVKAANNDGIWNENGVVVNFVVRRPFWRAWGPGLLAALSMLILAAWIAGLRRRSRRLRAAAVPGHLDIILEKFAISKREAEIVRLLLAGKSNKEIEDELFIAMATVKIHVHNIFQKVKVKNRLQLLLRIQQEEKKLR